MATGEPPESSEPCRAIAPSPRKVRSPWCNGHAVSFTVQWKDGVLTGGSAKVELLPGKTAAVASMQELIGGAAYGT